jgi:hypothetical protein
MSYAPKALIKLPFPLRCGALGHGNSSEVRVVSEVHYADADAAPYNNSITSNTFRFGSIIE